MPEAAVRYSVAIRGAYDGTGLDWTVIRPEQKKIKGRSILKSA